MLMTMEFVCNAYIRTTNELWKLWALPRTKGALYRHNIQMELVPSEPENTETLERYLLNIDKDEPDAEAEMFNQPSKSGPTTEEPGEASCFWHV